MRNILILLLSLSIVVSCNKEGKLTPSETSSITAYKFPEGTKFDKEVLAIAEEFDTKIFWTAVRNIDLNKVWTSSSVSGIKTANLLTEEQAGKSIETIKNLIFSKLDNKLFYKVIKPNVYMVYDLSQPVFGSTLRPIVADYSGIDSWVFSFFGEGAYKYPMYASDIHKVPEYNNEKLKFRYQFYAEMIKSLIVNHGVIKMPSVFNVDFDYKTSIKYGANDVNNENFYMNRGFCGSFNSFQANFSANRKIPTIIDNFFSYIFLVVLYTREDIENGTANIGGVSYSKYPIILKYYDIVDKFFISEYGYDLKKLKEL